MSFNTASLNSVTPAQTFMDTIKTIIDAHAAWVFVEQVIGTVTTNITDVYKCLGSVNSFGTDFYVGVCRSGATPATASVGFIIGETYDSTLKKFGKGGIWCSYGATLTVESDLSYLTPRHVANETTLAAITEGFLRSVCYSATHGVAPGTSGVAYNYWISVSNDRIVLNNSNLQPAVYLGLYDSFHSTALDPFPIIATGLIPTIYSTNETRLSPSMNCSGVFTRDAGPIGVTTGAFRGSSSGKAWTWQKGSVGAWFTSTPTKEPISGMWWASRIVVWPESRYGAVKGLFKPDVLLLNMGEASEAVGDNITISGVVYRCMATYSHTDGSTDIKSVWVSEAA